MVGLLGPCIVLADVSAAVCRVRQSHCYVGNAFVHGLHLLARLDLYHLVSDLLGPAIQLLRQCCRRYKRFLFRGISACYRCCWPHYRRCSQVDVDSEWGNLW